MYRVEFLRDDQVGISLHDSPISTLLLSTLRPLYPDFDQWLTRTIQEVREGTRWAIGVWKENRHDLKGVAILKITGVSLDIKTLFIARGIRGRVVSINTVGKGKVGDRLMEMVEAFARRRSVETLTVDIPKHGSRIHRFFLRHRFLVVKSHRRWGYPALHLTKKL